MKEKNRLLRILFLEENEPGIRLVETILRDALPEFELKTARTEKEFFKFVIRFQPDIILSAYHLEKYSATEAFQLLQQEHYQIPFIIVSDKLSEEVANELIRKGMEDCVFRSNLTRLPQVVLKAVAKKNIYSMKETAEIHLKHERGRLETIFKNTPEAIINIGFKGEILEINPTGLAMLEVDANKKLNRKDIFDFIHPDDLKRYKKFHNTVGIGNRKTERFKIIGSKKGEHWVEINGVPLFNEEDHIASILTIHRDVTEQHLAQEVINYHAKLFETISDAVISFDAEFRVRSWNKGAERIYGWKEKEVIGKKFTEFKWTKFTEEQLNELIKDAHLIDYIVKEAKFFRKDGKELTIRVSRSALKDESEKITGFVAVHTDMTERKIAEDLLRESKLRLETGQEIANLGYWERCLTTQQGVWSEQMFKILELKETNQALSIEDFLSCVHPDDRESLLNLRNKLIENNFKIEHRYRLLLKDGKMKHIQAVSQLLKNEAGIPWKLMGTIMDVTKLVQAKENELISEKKFQELFENSPDGIYVEDESGFILDANKVACTLQGYNKEELIGKNVLDITPDEFKSDLSSRFRSLFNQDETVIESFTLDRNWIPRPVEIKVNRITYSGKPAILVHARDISKRKAAEKAKRDSDLRFDALTDQAPVAIYHTDKKGKFIYLNKKFLDMFELTAEEVRRDEWKERIHPDDRTMFMKLRRDTMGTDEKIEVHYRLLIDDKIKYVFGSSNALLDCDGKLIGRIGTILDITENKLVKEKMLRTQTMFQSLFEHSPDSIFIEDLKGKILNVNSNACKLQGLEYDELVGKNIKDLVPANQHEALMRNHHQFCDGTLQRLKVSIWNKDGKEVPVEIRANLINYFDSIALLLHLSTVEN